MPGNPCRQHAVEHIDIAQNTFQNRVDRADAHQIARLLPRQILDAVIDHLIHRFLGFTDGRTADRIPREIHLRQRFSAHLAQILILSTLDDAEQRLFLRTLMCIFSPLGPTQRSLHAVFHVIIGAGIRSALIKAHDDIRADLVLNLNGFFRTQK